MVVIYNTLTGKKERMKPPKPGRQKKPLRLFVCGPTVYDYSHLGHARTYLAFDTIVNYLRHREFPVFYLQNITDIDDKIIERAVEERKNPKELAVFFEKTYYQDMKSLGIKSVNKYERASDHIQEIQSQISRLFKKGYAYQTKNGVYFSVKKFKNYGILSRQNLDELRHGWRIEPDLEKKDPLDFALWKFIKPNAKELFWPSPWGDGRPGWHIEDTAIAEAIFGKLQYELHGGAIDLKFPHHESEIAQAEAISGKKPYVKIWLHTGVLLVEEEKMSKSLRNFITIRDFLKRHPVAVMRVAFLRHHYRSPINYNQGFVIQAANALNSILEFLSKLNLIKKNGAVGSMTREKIETAKKEFYAKMDEDFNTPEALAALFKLIGGFQSQIQSLNKKEAILIKNTVVKQLRILGVKPPSSSMPPNIRSLIAARERIRAKREFSRADHLRKKIETLGYMVEDTPMGPVAWKKMVPDYNQ